MNDGGPAFPVPDRTIRPSDDGMSLRDWFAGQALIGAIAAPYGRVKPTDTPFETVAQLCYLQADALLAERERKP